jgi:hypothetical protein
LRLLLLLLLSPYLLLLCLLPPNLLRGLLTPYLLRSRLLVNAFLFASLSRRHSINLLLGGRLLERRLGLLPLSSTAVAAATALRSTSSSLMLLLSRRPAVRIAAAMALALSKYVLIRAEYQQKPERDRGNKSS